MDSRDQPPYTDCPPTRLRAVRIRRKSQQKPTQTLVLTEPTLESRIRKERESQELDEKSKSTLECSSSWCQVLEEWRRCSSYGNPCKELAIHLHWHRRDPMKGPITSPPVHGNLYKWNTHPPTESTWQSYGWSIRRPSCIWICWFQWMCSFLNVILVKG